MNKRLYFEGTDLHYGNSISFIGAHGYAVGWFCIGVLARVASYRELILLTIPWRFWSLLCSQELPGFLELAGACWMLPESFTWRSLGVTRRSLRDPVGIPWGRSRGGLVRSILKVGSRIRSE